MLWMMTWMKGDKALLESYRSCYRSLREQTIADAGHMMHHDQPERKRCTRNSVPRYPT